MSVIGAASPCTKTTVLVQLSGNTRAKPRPRQQARRASPPCPDGWVQAAHRRRRGLRLEQPTKSCRADTDPFSVRARHPSAPCPPRLWRDCVRELLGRVVQPGNEPLIGVPPMGSVTTLSNVRVAGV